MSVPAIASILAALLSVSFVMEGIDAQTCQDVNDCTTDYGYAKSVAGQNQGKLCSAVNVYIRCLETAGKKCNTDVTPTLEAAEKTLIQFCTTSKGGYATPFLGFVTMVLGVLILRSV